jgi:hypothetical protein
MQLEAVGAVWYELLFIYGTGQTEVSEQPVSLSSILGETAVQ